MNLSPIVFDIETTGLSSTHCSIIAIGYQTDPINTIVITDEGRTEREMLKEFLDVLNKIEDPILIGYNCRSFDIPFVVARCMKYHLTPDPLLHPLSLDLMLLFGMNCLSNKTRCKLTEACEFFDIAKDDETDGSMMPKFYADKDYEKIDYHCRIDVLSTFGLFERMIPICKNYLRVKNIFKSLEGYDDTK